jgi:hypothetical protein
VPRGSLSAASTAAIDFQATIGIQVTIAPALLDAPAAAVSGHCKPAPGRHHGIGKERLAATCPPGGRGRQGSSSDGGDADGAGVTCGGVSSGSVGGARVDGAGAHDASSASAREKHLIGDPAYQRIYARSRWFGRGVDGTRFRLDGAKRSPGETRTGRWSKR